MQLFKLRAECHQDVLSFAKLMPQEFAQYATVTQRMLCLADVELTFSSEMTLEDIRYVLRQVPDGHVMVQTLMPIERYTGDRNYNL